MAEADKEPIRDIITVLTEFCPHFEWKVSASSENKNQSLPIFQPRHSCPDGIGEAPPFRQGLHQVPDKLFVFLRGEVFLPVHVIDGKFLHFPVILYFRHRGLVREIDGVAYFAIGAEQGSDGYLPAVIPSAPFIALPTEIAVPDVHAQPVQINHIRVFSVIHVLICLGRGLLPSAVIRNGSQ